MGEALKGKQNTTNGVLKIQKEMNTELAMLLGSRTKGKGQRNGREGHEGKRHQHHRLQAGSHFENKHSQVP